MDFVLTEAHEEEKSALQVSDDEIEESNEESAFIDDMPIEQESISSYRDLSNLEHYPKFQNQTRNPIKVTYADTEDYFGEDNQTERYDTEEQDNVTYDFFKDFKKPAEKIRLTLLSFENVENHFLCCNLWSNVQKS